jgi:hypothetical protein
MVPHPLSTTKFGFRIRTRDGLVVENLMIHGRDEADAQRKLTQMYRQCEVLECRVRSGPARAAPGRHATFEEVIELVSK